MGSCCSNEDNEIEKLYHKNKKNLNKDYNIINVETKKVQNI